MSHPLARRAFPGGAPAAPPGPSGGSPAAAAGPGAFIDALHSDRPAADRADKMSLYAFLVGSWESEILAYEESGASWRLQVEVLARRT
jgi:hypothetical protein